MICQADFSDSGRPQTSMIVIRTALAQPPTSNKRPFLHFPIYFREEVK